MLTCFLMVYDCFILSYVAVSRQTAIGKYIDLSKDGK